MNVAIVGAGLQGRRHAAAIAECGDRVVLVADLDPRAAEALARSAGADVARNSERAVTAPEVQAVVVCTPPAAHEHICTATARAGKAVLCEKPLALDVAGAERIVRAASEAGVVLATGFNLRHHRGLQQARAWLDAGAVGAPMYVRARYGIAGRPGYEREWRADPEVSGGGQVMDQAVHLIDLAAWFLGDFAEASAMLTTSGWAMPVEDNAFALLRTAEGRVASLHASWTEWKNQFAFECFGREGYVRVEGLGGSYGTARAALGRRDPDAPFAEHTIEYRGADSSWAAQWRDFRAAIEQGRAPLADGAAGLAANRVADAIYRAHRDGRTVAVAPAEVLAA